MSDLADGVGLYRLALAYRRSADQLLDHLDNDHTKNYASILPIQFLYSHAVELLFKAFLRYKGFSENLIKHKYRHDIAKLYDECNKQGLALSSVEHQSLLRLIPLLKDGHVEYQYRYFAKSFSTADPEWMCLDVGKLADAVGAEFEKQRQTAEQKAKEAGMGSVQIPIKMLGFTIMGRND